MKIKIKVDNLIKEMKVRNVDHIEQVRANKSAIHVDKSKIIERKKKYKNKLEEI